MNEGKKIMELHQTAPSSSPLINGQIKEKPKKLLSPGVVKRLALHKPLDVAIARTTIRRLADELGYSLIDQVRLSTAIFEIADNIVDYAGKGEIIISWREDAQHKGLQLLCNDQGVHAPELTRFFQMGGSNENEYRLNVLTPKKLVDEFEFTEDPKDGNCIKMTVWLEEAGPYDLQ
jgi:serine/threonine-protein kinase RsbT